jgi:hypothetical protein
LDQQNYDAQPPVPQRRLPLDPRTIGVILIAGVAFLACIGAVGVVCLLSVLGPPPAPATPRPATNPTAVLNVGTLLATASPTVDAANIGQFVTRISAQLAGMTVLRSTC